MDQRTAYSSGVELNNWDFSHKGAMTLRTALVYSRNTTTLQTFKAVGETNIKSFLNNLDIQIKNDGQNYLVAIGADISPIKWLPHMPHLVITVLIQTIYSNKKSQLVMAK